MILNLTQHPASEEQLDAGVMDVHPADLSTLKMWLTFDELPSVHEISVHVDGLGSLAATYADVCSQVMIGGAPFLMEQLSADLRERGLTPVFAFSKRESVEITDASGAVRKTSVFRHLGFVHPA